MFVCDGVFDVENGLTHFDGWPDTVHDVTVTARLGRKHTRVRTKLIQHLTEHLERLVVAGFELVWPFPSSLSQICLFVCLSEWLTVFNAECCKSVCVCVYCRCLDV